MAADAFTPRTTKQRLPTPLNGTLHTTTRMVAQEKPLPVIGGTMEAELGPAWADSIVIAVSEPPDKSQGVLTITHVRIPSEDAQLSSNWEQVRVPIGGKQYPGIVRSVILASSDYQDDFPAIDSALPVIAGGLFDNDGYVLYDRECVKSGMELEPTFRVDRRTYVITSALTGEEYGDIVTKSVSDSIVTDGTAADTGLDVISSTVDPLGNGKAIKQTKRAKSPGWPNPLDKEVSKENGNTPPARYTRDITRTKTTRKIALSDIPSTPTLSGNEIGKAYKKETPDRAEEIVTTQALTLNTSTIDEAIEQKPFVSIKSQMTPGTSAVVPPAGNGSAKLVYEAPDGSKIYENTAEIATARPGLKGVETNAQQWGSLVSTTNWTTSATAPAGGSVQLVYNDRLVSVYETTQTAVSVSGSTKEVDPNAWGKLVWNGTYSKASGGDKSRQVWSDGVNAVYLNENASLSISGSTKEVDPNSWGSIEWNGTYSTGSGGEKSRQVYSGPGGSVFLNETATIKIAGGSFVSEKEKNPLYTLTDTSSFGTSAAAQGELSRSRLVFSQNGNRVFENITTSVTPGATRNYKSVVRFAVPPILKNIEFVTLVKKSGGKDILFYPEIEEGIEGYFEATVKERFELVPTMASEPIVTFNPVPISISTPWGSCNIGATLHQAFPSFQWEIGADDPVYAPYKKVFTIKATSPPTWRGKTVLVAYQTDPYKNGYITREVYVKLPS